MSRLRLVCEPPQPSSVILLTKNVHFETEASRLVQRGGNRRGCPQTPLPYLAPSMIKFHKRKCLRSSIQYCRLTNILQRSYILYDVSSSFLRISRNVGQLTSWTMKQRAVRLCNSNYSVHLDQFNEKCNINWSSAVNLRDTSLSGCRGRTLTCLITGLMTHVRRSKRMSASFSSDLQALPTPDPLLTGISIRET